MLSQILNENRRKYLFLSNSCIFVYESRPYIEMNRIQNLYDFGKRQLRCP
jgi:hypothetical protein